MEKYLNRSVAFWNVAYNEKLIFNLTPHIFFLFLIIVNK